MFSPRDVKVLQRTYEDAWPFLNFLTALRLSLESVCAYHIFKIFYTSIFFKMYATSPKTKDFLRFIAEAPAIVVNFQWAYVFCSDSWITEI